MAAKKSRKRKSASTPWERPAPRGSRHTKLTSEDKAQAKRRAKKAGRTYPNLVDNMAQAQKKRGTRRTRTEDPRGGVAVASRALFSRQDDARSKPAAEKAEKDASPAEKKRKGWGSLVPRTIAAARRIAAKGRRLLDRYRLQQA